ncbi:lipid IV(A) 3-deoxy-D-manno-octulosonic acid transferase [Candidatus Gillettellia adelgis]
MLFYFYQVLMYLIQPVLFLRLLLRSYRMPAYRKRWAERYGYCNGKVISGSIVVHAVSIGETLAVIPVVKALRCRYPYLPITVTTITPAGSECVQSTFGKDIYHVYLPYDLRSSINRFLDQVDPTLMIIMETELWPNLINALHQRRIPLVIANARLSARSAAGYKKIGSFIRNMLNHITLIAVQNQEDGNRFIELGLQSSQLTMMGSLKFHVSITMEMASRIISLRRQWVLHRPVWIATSTHNGEENIVLTAQRKLLEKYPDLLLILVPRHPERFMTTKKLVNKAGFNYIMRSSGAIPSMNTHIVIGDTIGELMLLYGIADLAFVGGSLVKHGGHNPLEAAVHAIPVLMGPNTFNFHDICTKLSKEKGLITVFDTDSLINAVDSLLTNEDYRRDYGCHAVDVLYKNQGALQCLLQLLTPYLPPRR